MKRLLAVLFIVSCCNLSVAQFDPNYTPEEEVSKGNFGLGIGLNYGGLGARVEFLPVKNFALFAAAGFNFHKLGYNFGLIGRLLPDKKVCPVLEAMYGYNGVIVVIGADQYNKTYYGPTIGGELK